MKTVIGNQTFITKFAYPIITRTVGDKVVNQRESVCYIKHSKSQTESEIIVQDSVKTDSRDSFIKAKGRNLAFKKTLNKLFADKTLRKQFGLTNVEFDQFVSDYYNQCPTSVMLYNY